MNIEQLKHKFKQVKRVVQKQYPNATTAVDLDGRFYVADENGYRILRDMNLYPSQRDVYTAWIMVQQVTKIETIMNRNNQRFSDEKICKSSEKL